MTATLFDSLKTKLRGRVMVGEPLSRHTTWRVGGPAEVLVEPADCDDLLLLLRQLQLWGVPWLVIGAGSNLLVRDGGIRGVVIHLGSFRGLNFASDGTVRAGGGLPLMSLVRESAARGRGGLEALSGIPGTVGGAVVMNAGAGGCEMADVVTAVEVVDADGVREVPAADLGFGYRRSNLDGRGVVTEVMLRTEPADPQLLARLMAERLAERRRSQRVGGPNAGSVFKNPPGASAWRLIDEAGLRGTAVGAARVSPHHANFIVNEGGATASDILTLIDRIRDAVRSHSGIELEPEVRIVGEER